ncbi:MAG: hypothetical protein WCC12_12295 [Anaerolineales bacterium]
MISYDVAGFRAPLMRFGRPTPQPQGAELLVRTLAAGVCHSDLDIDATEREAALRAGALAAVVLGP